MKTQPQALVLLVFSLPLFLLSGCDLLNGDDDNDDNGMPKKNELVYDNQRYPLSKGYLLYFGEWQGAHDFDLILVSDGINFTADADFSGSGHGMVAIVYSNANNQLTPGNYSFDDDEEGEAFTFTDADIFINYNVDTDAGTIIGIIDGLLQVKKTGNTYELDLNANTPGNKAARVNFTGPLTFIDTQPTDKAKRPRPGIFHLE